MTQEKLRTATFAGGCFWCTEAAYKDVEGVESVTSGYAGGKKETADYEQVSTGNTHHREAVQLEYDPEVASYEELLDIFWKSIDPTDEKGQFADRGFQYTTAIYYHDQEQKEIAERSKKDLEQSGKFDEPIATEIEEFTTFFPAEEYHQDYSEKKSLQYKAYKQASGREGFLKKLWEKTPLG